MSISTRKEILDEKVSPQTVVTISPQKALRMEKAREAAMKLGILPTNSTFINSHIALKRAMQAVSFSELTNIGLHFITKNTADILTRHHHPIVKELGTKCLATYNENSAYIEAETGFVRSEVRTLNFMCFARKGYIFWHKDYSWQWYALDTIPNRYEHNYIWRQAWYSEPPTPTTFKLLTPTHVAALIGDLELMKSLIKKGFKIDESPNLFNVTELELAIIGNSEEMITYLFDIMPRKNSHNALRYAIENNVSKAIIDKIIGYYTISDECIALAKKRDNNLGLYLEKYRAEIMQNNREMEYLLESPLQSPDSMRMLICTNPQIVSRVKDPKKGNTLLHELILEKNIDKLRHI